MRRKLFKIGILLSGYLLLLANPLMILAAEDLEGLPGPNDRQGRAVLSKSNVEQYRGLLLEPIADWVRSGQFVARMVSSLDYSWELEPEWEQQSDRNKGLYQLGPDSSLVTRDDTAVQGGIPFPSLSFATSSSDAAESTEQMQGAAILWNSVYTQAAPGELLYDVELAWVGAQSAVRRSRGQLLQSWVLQPNADKQSLPPPQETTENKDVNVQEPNAPRPLFSGSGDILLRQVLQLQSPPVVFGYAQLLERLRGAGADRAWMYSPVIGSSREIPPAHRGDSVLNGVLAMDDFLIFGSKIQSCRIRLLAKKRLLVPFPALTPFGLEQGEGGSGELSARGYHQSFDGAASMVRWNYETRQFPSFASWLPTTIFLVPREVWLLEIVPQNPFYRTGRELLVIDTESMLPVYKLVYTHRSTLERVVVAGWGLASDESGAHRIPFAAFMFGVDSNGRVATTMSTLQVTALTDSKSERASQVRQLLAIEAHGSKSAQKDSSPSEPATPADEPADDSPATPKLPPRPKL